MNLPIILTGKIIHGKGLGRTVGMPTANLRFVDMDLLPEEGVYATRIFVNGGWFHSVTNIGRRPTVDSEESITVETYILDFDEDIYGETVELEVRKFLRPIQKFENLEEVHEQVKKDIEQVKNYLDIVLTK